ncbi:MAG: hypothetical protein KC416_12610, partial [Myxococcales bacterium]|nr:hypothetical protein [Myxococcales bacterium]
MGRSVTPKKHLNRSHPDKDYGFGSGTAAAITLRPTRLEGVERTKHMDNQIAGQWKQIKGKVQQQWGKLTNDD